MPSPADSVDQNAATLLIEGMPRGWAVTFNGQRAVHTGASSDTAQYLAVVGRVTVAATKNYVTRSAVLRIGPGPNVVAWSEFRAAASASNKNAIAGVVVATTMAGMVYLGRR